MNQGAQDAADQKSKAYLLPSNQETTGRHKLHVSPADCSAFGNEKDQKQGNADAEQADQRIHPRQACEKSEKGRRAERQTAGRTRSAAEKKTTEYRALRSVCFDQFYR